MASIEFSPGFRTGLPSRLLRADDPYTGGDALHEFGFLSRNSQFDHKPSFYIFSGQKQSISYCKDNTNSSNLINNNCLIQFTMNDLRSATLTEADRIKFISEYRQATKTGQATWFCFCRKCYNINHTVILTMGAHCIIGDIGLIGSGADLELPDTNIVLGQNYRLDNFKINIPYSWTY